MTTTKRLARSRWAVAALVAVAGLWAVEAVARASGAEEAPEAPAAEEAEGAAAAPSESAAPTEAAAAPEGAPRQTRAVPERLARLGRVEAILLENEDPESAIEFAGELLAEHGEDGQIQLLVAACQMRLRRHADAAASYERAVAQSADDPVLRLHALYGLGRAQHMTGQLAEAVATLGRYVEHARAHESLPNFVGEAERLAAALRARVEAESRTPARRRRR